MSPDARADSGVADTQPTEVHIHIGRIELSAAPAPEPKRREPARTRQPMSLDEYLQHRNGRTR